MTRPIAYPALSDNEVLVLIGARMVRKNGLLLDETRFFFEDIDRIGIKVDKVEKWVDSGLWYKVSFISKEDIHLSIVSGLIREAESNEYPLCKVKGKMYVYKKD